MLQETPNSSPNLPQPDLIQDVNDGQNSGQTFREDPLVLGHDREDIQIPAPDSPRDVASMREDYSSRSIRQGADGPQPPSVPNAVLESNVHSESQGPRNATYSIDYPDIHTPSTATLPPNGTHIPAVNVTNYGSPLPGAPAMPQSYPMYHQMWPANSFTGPHPQPQSSNTAQFHIASQSFPGSAYASPPLITPQPLLPPTFEHNSNVTPSYPQPAGSPRGMSSVDIVAAAAAMPPQSSTTRPILRNRRQSRESSSRGDPYNRRRGSRNESWTSGPHSRPSRSSTAASMPMAQDFNGSSNIRPTMPQARIQQPPFSPRQTPYTPSRSFPRRSNSANVILTAMNSALPGERPSVHTSRRRSHARSSTSRRAADEPYTHLYRTPNVDGYADYSGGSYSRSASRSRWGIEADRRPHSPRLYQSAMGDYDDYAGHPYSRWGHSPHRWAPSPRPRLYQPSVYDYRPGRSYPPFPYAWPPPPGYAESFVPIETDQDSYSSYYKGFWNRIGTFFKSPFQRGQLQAFQAPYPTEKHDGILLLLFLEVVFSQIYFHALLRLPSLYFSRVKRFFDETNLNLFEITEMAFETAKPSAPRNDPSRALGQQGPEGHAHKVPPQYERLKNS